MEGESLVHVLDASTVPCSLETFSIQAPPSNSKKLKKANETLKTTAFHSYVFDSLFEEATLQWIDELRLSLALNSKRPTVDRRFFADGQDVWNGLQPPPSWSLGKSSSLSSSESRAVHNHLDSERPICILLEHAIQRGLKKLVTAQAQTSTELELPDNYTVYVFRYQRFLEYTQELSQLDPHTDGTKVCEDTGRVSSHTMLLYLTDCLEGGQTLLLNECTKEMPSVDEGNEKKEMPDNKIPFYATRPKRGRILLFPHALPHAGAPVVSLPKICLRAEVAIHTSRNGEVP